MKNALKTLGLLLIVAAAFLIASCGPPVEPTEDYIVTFNSDGGSSVPSKSVPNDGNSTVDKPSPDPTKTELATPGLYKNFTGYTFDGWTTLNGEDYNFSTPVSGSITLTAKWKIPEGVEVNLDTTGTATDDIVTKTFAKLNDTNTAIVDNDKFTLYINADVTPAKALVLNRSKADLTITSANQKAITSPDLSAVQNSTNNNANVFITIGAGNNPTASSATNLDKTVKLTLKNVAVLGASTKETPKPVGNSLIRVMNGAELTLDKAYISDHISNSGLSATTTSTNGQFGNGSAICIINGSTLNVTGASIIEKNKSTGNQPNKNLVGGIYAIGTTLTTGNQNRSTVNLTNGTIEKNEATDGNTADIYITEFVDLNLDGYVTVGELALNAETATDRPNFTIKGKVYNTIEKLNLRGGSDTLTAVQGFWKTKAVFSGTSGANGYTITDDDVKKFKLWEFTGRASLRGTNPGDDNTKWPNWIDPEKWAITITDNKGIFDEVK